VQRLLDEADAGSIKLFMSMINVGEVFYILAKRRSRFQGEAFLEKVLPGMPLEIVVPDRALILEAAQWKANCRISYADGFALATAARLNTGVVTGDPEMRELDAKLIEWVGA
jgi:predicted nucleic acid-binding protein